jgi:hypothetical protein
MTWPQVLVTTVSRPDAESCGPAPSASSGSHLDDGDQIIDAAEVLRRIRIGWARSPVGKPS